LWHRPEKLLAHGLAEWLVSHLQSRCIGCLGIVAGDISKLIFPVGSGFAIDNNAAEREMKRIAIGRKNWLFTGRDRGGATAAVLFSITSSCQRHGLDPFAYLRDVLARLPDQSPERLEELLPDRWAAVQKAAPA
jgi:hypothetical protein